MKTNSKEYRKRFREYLVSTIYDIEDMPEQFQGTEEGAFRYLWARFHREYNYPNNRKRIPNGQARVAEWLSGLPLNIACYYCDIVELAERLSDETYTEKQRETIQNNWFSFAAFQLMKAWEFHKIKTEL